ncbi:MAG: hypothetical protein J6B71_07735 [Clostridia bacterium]|nr:hypothetical protein [Clostridia bacterium]
MKNNKMMRIAAVILMMTLLTTCAISGTFAKYVSTANGSDTARVAKWSFKVGTTDIAPSATNEFTFNLFTTVYDTNNTSPNENTKNDTDVSDGTENTVIIAPGTWGYFDIELTNASEVTASYAISFAETTTSTVPLKFQKAIVEENAAVEYPTNSWGDLNTINVAAENLAINGSTTIRVYWQWAYDGVDTDDTALGTAQSLANVTIKATVDVTQVD